MDALSLSASSMALGAGRTGPPAPTREALTKIHARLRSEQSELYAGIASGLVEAFPDSPAFAGSPGNELRGLHLAITDGADAATLETSNAFLVGRFAAFGNLGPGAAALGELVKRANMKGRGRSMPERRLYLEAFGILTAAAERDRRTRELLDVAGFRVPRVGEGVYISASDTALKAEAFSVARIPQPLPDRVPNRAYRPFTLERTVEAVRKRIGLTAYLEQAKKREANQ